MCHTSSKGIVTVAKSGLWYVVSNFFIKGFVFITIPIFSRLMTPEEFGNYSNFMAWLNLFTVVVTLNLYTSVNRARLDYKENLDAYCSSILILGSLSTFLFYIITYYFIDYVMDITSLDMFYINIIYIYLIFQPALSIFQIYQRVIYKYKISVFISTLTTFTVLFSSLLLVFVIHDKFLARVIGYIVPMSITCICLYLVILFRGKVFDWSYCKYALCYSWPFIPHLLATYILTSSGRVMITNFCGSEYTAIYTVGSTCMNIMTVYLFSLNNAVSPWIFDQMNLRNYKIINKFTLLYILIFYIPLHIVLLLSPEILTLLGDSRYKTAIDIIPILTLSVFFQFTYCLYVNVEQYARKAWAIAGGTLIAASLNVCLNYIFLPRYGFHVSAYITFFTYLILFIIHFSFVKFMHYPPIYNDKYVIISLIIALFLHLLITSLYANNTLRYLLFLIESIVIVYIFVRYRNNILLFLKIAK